MQRERAVQPLQGEPDWAKMLVERTAGACKVSRSDRTRIAGIAHLLVVRQALLIHEPFLVAAERSTAASTAEALLMEAATAPRHSNTRSHTKLSPAGEATRALLFERRFGKVGTGSLRRGIGIVVRLLKPRDDRSIRLRRRRALQERVD